MRTSTEGRADLHVHTLWSDGAQRPEAIVNTARGRLDVLAITDHDEIRGAVRAREWALARPELGVDVVVGEEISMDHWESALETLGGFCRPIALELPIFDAGLVDVSVPDLADHVRRFLETLELPPSVVGGNSLGGHIALELALTHPGWVSGLILTGSSGLFKRTFTRKVPHRPTAGYVRSRMEEIFYDPGLVTPQWVEAIRHIVTTPHLTLRVLRAARAAKHHNVEERLGDIRVPTLIVWGKEDRITPPEVAERFHTRIPGSHLVYLPNCGHAPMLERPEAFDAAVSEWLIETRARRAGTGGCR